MLYRGMKFSVHLHCMSYITRSSKDRDRWWRRWISRFKAHRFWERCHRGKRRNTDRDSDRVPDVPGKLNFSISSLALGKHSSWPLTTKVFSDNWTAILVISAQTRRRKIKFNKSFYTPASDSTSPLGSLQTSDLQKETEFDNHNTLQRTQNSSSGRPWAKWKFKNSDCNQSVDSLQPESSSSPPQNLTKRLRRIFIWESLEKHAQLQGKGLARYHLKILALDSFTTLK
jgi:hypothetical protein